MSSPLKNWVRERRVARGLSQVELAAAARLTRQSVGAIEVGRATPAVDVALRLAAALDCRVEDLFGAAEAERTILSEPASPQTVGRVALVQIAGRWVSHGLGAQAMHTRADGVVQGVRRGGLEVQLLLPSPDPAENFVLMGCAAGLGILADRLNSRAGAGRFIWLPRSSTDALHALARERTHAAGVHLVDPKTGEANVPDVRRLVRKTSVTLVTLARWEAGLVTAPGNPLKLRSCADLGRRGLRLVVRERGSGARQLLERGLRQAGLHKLLGSARVQAPGHLEVASAVSMSAADAGIATRDAAIAYGLGFVPLADERYDIAIPTDSLEDARAQRLFDMLTSVALRRELSALGYDVSCGGDRVADLPAA